MGDKAKLGARVVLGLIFTVFCLNGFLNFIQPPPPTEAGMAFLGALGASGYFFPVLKVTEIVGGVLLLANKFVGLALVLLAPIVVQIFLYHVFLDMNGMPMAVVMVLLQGYLGFFAYKDKFKALLKP